MRPIVPGGVQWSWVIIEHRFSATRALLYDSTRLDVKQWLRPCLAWLLE